MLVPLNWRLAVPEQVFILSDASVKALVVEDGFAAVIPPLSQALPDVHVIGLDFAPGGVSFDDLIASGRGEDRNPHIDFSCPLLVVYTSGTTGRPKGAVLRQEALLWNAAMSQHMHGLTADDHARRDVAGRDRGRGGKDRRLLDDGDAESMERLR